MKKSQVFPLPRPCIMINAGLPAHPYFIETDQNKASDSNQYCQMPLFIYFLSIIP